MIYAFVITMSVTVFSIFGWAIGLAVIELFTRHNGAGLNFFESDPMHDMSSWFAPMNATEFYGYDPEQYIERVPKHLRYISQ